MFERRRHIDARWWRKKSGGCSGDIDGVRGKYGKMFHGRTVPSDEAPTMHAAAAAMELSKQHFFGGFVVHCQILVGLDVP